MKRDGGTSEASGGDGVQVGQAVQQRASVDHEVDEVAVHLEVPAGEEPPGRVAGARPKVAYSADMP